MDPARCPGWFCDPANAAAGANGSDRHVAWREAVLDQARGRAGQARRWEDGYSAGEKSEDPLSGQSDLGPVAAVPAGSRRGDRGRCEQATEVMRLRRVRVPNLAYARRLWSELRNQRGAGDFRSAAFGSEGPNLCPAAMAELQIHHPRPQPQSHSFAMT